MACNVFKLLELLWLHPPDVQACTSMYAENSCSRSVFWRLRPYHAECTGSRPITEVKQRRAGSVLDRLGTSGVVGFFLFTCIFIFLPHITWIVILLIRASMSRFRSFLLEISVECDVKASNTNCVCPIHYSPKRFSIIENHIWNRNLIGAYFDAYDHTTLNAPVPVRSPKLSSVGPDQYLDGWPPGNIRCCRLLFIYLYFFLPDITWIVILLIRASMSQFR